MEKIHKKSRQGHKYDGTQKQSQNIEFRDRGILTCDPEDHDQKHELSPNDLKTLRHTEEHNEKIGCLDAKKLRGFHEEKGLIYTG